MLEEVFAVFPRLRCRGRYWSLRLVDEAGEVLAVRRDAAQPPERIHDCGAMLTVLKDGGSGYAATGDLSAAGLQAALDRATGWAEASAARSAVDFTHFPGSAQVGEYASPAPSSAPLSRSEWYELLAAESASARIHDRIVDWEASVETRTATHGFVSSAGARIVQHYRFLMPGLSATASDGSGAQTRTLNGQRGICQQGGVEILGRFGFAGGMRRVAEEALALLSAPNCPSGTLDALLLPDQMILQIHESIGHPLELDRILGDERNYAGTSFVTPAMFGNYRYGSELLNVTFDPTRAEELASYGYDDEGTPAARVHLIRKGILERPLGSALSQHRCGLPGVANLRADGWNRPPIDRMANLNLEPGESSLDELIASIDRGVMLGTNNSWSIDDSRNKFQFGCEIGWRIDGGKLGTLVRNPSYRGISANFWRSLRGVGNASTMQVLGTPWCGKGEPSQLIRVGHASPACVFAEVDVFGGEP